MNVPAISSLAGVQPLSLPGAKANSSSFSTALASAVSAVEASGKTAEASIQGFMNGSSQDIHSVALATQRAELSLELFQQVRNKFVQAYQEVMRMQM